MKNVDWVACWVIVLATVTILFIGYVTVHAQTQAYPSWSPQSGTVLPGTTGSIGGGLLVAGASASGTVSVPGAAVGMTCIAQASDGTNIAALGAAPVCTVTAGGVVTVSVVAIVSLTPTAKTYTVRVIP